jgi:hypothetical protein
MKNDTVQERFEDAIRDLREYGTLQWESLRLRVLEELAVFFNAVAGSFVIVMLGAIALLFLGVLFTLLLAELTGSWLLAVGIMTLIFIVAAVIVYAKRKTIFLDPMVRLLAKMLFTPKERSEP